MEKKNPEIEASIYINGIFEKHIHQVSPDGIEHIVEIYALDMEKAEKMLVQFTEFIKVYKTI